MDFKILLNSYNGYRKINMFEKEIELFYLLNNKKFNIKVIQKPNYRYSLVLYVFTILSGISLYLFALSNNADAISRILMQLALYILLFGFIFPPIFTEIKERTMRKNLLMNKIPLWDVIIYNQQMKNLKNIKNNYNEEYPSDIQIKGNSQIILDDISFFGILVFDKNSQIFTTDNTLSLHEIRLLPTSLQNWQDFELFDSTKIILPVAVDTNLKIFSLLNLSFEKHITRIRSSKYVYIHFVRYSLLLKILNQKMVIKTPKSDFFFEHGFLYTNIITPSDGMSYPKNPHI